MHQIESIGPVLGIIAFVGLAVLAFLIFQQARDIRRLREWAGRAPERAEEAADAVQAAAESRREPDALAPEDEPAAAEAAGIRGRLGAAWARVKAAFGPPLSEVDRRLPVDGRYLLAVGAVALAAAAVLTSGFGLVGGSTDKHHKHASTGTRKVAVLNGTSAPGLAALVEQQVIHPSGYKAAAVTNTVSSIANTVVMYEPGQDAAAKALATAIQPKLGKTPVQEMTSEIKARAGGAPLALVLGIDDAGFGGG
jgi:hypothetical protein